jgi:hypothetical protein
MAETRVENQVCQACGAYVRPGSLYCYNCGSAVVETAKKNKYETGKLEFNGNLEIKSSNHTETAYKPIDKPIDKPFAEPFAKGAQAENKKLNVQPQNKIKTAASANQRLRQSENKTVEVVWEKPESSTSVWFVVASLILVLFALFIWWAAQYLH